MGEDDLNRNKFSLESTNIQLIKTLKLEPTSNMKSVVRQVNCPNDFNASSYRQFDDD